MANGLTNHSVDASATRKSVCTIEIRHLVERDLARGGGGGDRCVCQRASPAQGEDSRGKADFSHWDRNKIPGTAGQAQEPNGVVDGARFGGDLHGVDTAESRRIYGARQVRRALKIMHGEHDTRRYGIFPNGLAGKLAQGFHFEVAPLATGFASLNQPVEFAVNTAGKLTSTLAAAAGGYKCGA